MAQMWITMGPQHPMTHGLWTLRVKVDGETVVDTEAELGYIHRGVEKIAEARDFTQVTPYCDRLCYVSAMTWANSYIYAAEVFLRLRFRNEPNTSASFQQKSRDLLLTLCGLERLDQISVTSRS